MTKLITALLMIGLTACASTPSSPPLISESLTGLRMIPSVPDTVWEGRGLYHIPTGITFCVEQDECYVIPPEIAAQVIIKDLESLDKSLGETF